MLQHNKSVFQFLLAKQTNLEIFRSSKMVWQESPLTEVY